MIAAGFKATAKLFQSGCIMLHFYQPYTCDLVSPYLYQTLVSLLIFTLSVSKCVQYYHFNFSLMMLGIVSCDYLLSVYPLW